MPNILWRRQAVESATGLSRSTIYQKMAEGEFPRPMRIGKRAVAWRADDVRDWIDNCETAA